MTKTASRGWDMFAAEYADTRRGGKDARRKQPCVYCGNPTKALSRVCCDHDDLPAREVDAALDVVVSEHERS